MHRVPLARRSWHVLDATAVCAASGAVADVDRTRRLSALLALAGDPTRLALLQCLRATTEMCVTDLAVATGVERSAVSHALRSLRAAGVVASSRESRLARYRLVDPLLGELLDLLDARVPSSVVHEGACAHA